MANQVHQLSLKLKALAKSNGGNRLPSVRGLAATWGVSSRTAQLAIQEAVAQGWIETRRGAGIWPRGFVPVAPPIPDRTDARRIAEILRSEILSGQFASDQFLPSPKDCSKKFGVHPATVRKSFGQLLSMELVVRKGRSWAVRIPSAKRPPASLVLLCIGAADEQGRLRISSDREWDFWREIQQEALRCGLEPKIVPIGNHLPELDGPIFGAVVSNWHMTESGPLLDKLQRMRIPTAFWVANEETLPGLRYKQSRGLWFHDLAHGRSAGRIMADFVNRSACRKIAWISPFHGSTWSRNRLEGLKSRLDPTIEVVEAVHDWISEWDVQVQVAWNPLVTNRVDLDGVDPTVDPDDLRRPLVETLTRMRCMDVFGPALENALRSKAELLIASSDLVAEWTLHWLEGRGLRVPRDLAIASFDDTREATRRNLTSFRFDITGMARTMVRQVLSSKQDHKLVTRYTGQVVARESTTQPQSDMHRKE